MIRVGSANSSEDSLCMTKGVMRGVGRVVWAQNYWGDWVKQIMHRSEVGYSPGQRGEEWEAFIDGLTEKYRRVE